MTGTPDTTTPNNAIVAWREWQLAADSSYPLVMATVDSNTDLMGPLLGSLTPLTGVQHVGVQLILSPTRGRWQWWARMRAAIMLEDAKLTDQPHLKDVGTAIQAKAAEKGFRTVLRAVVIAVDPEVAERQLAQVSSIVAQYTQERGDVTQSWKHSKGGIDRCGASQVAHLPNRDLPALLARSIPLPPLWPEQRSSILVPSEITLHWHFPTQRDVHVARWRRNRYLPPDPRIIVGDMDQPPPIYDETVPIKDRVIRVARGRRPDGTPVYLGVPLGALSTHGHIIAPSGSGKSHLTKVFLGEVFRVGAGAILTDFKGDTVDDAILMVPLDREGDVAIFDPTDTEWPVGLNLLDAQSLPAGVDTDTLISLVESTFAAMDENWQKSVGMQQFIGWGAKALIEGEPNATLAHLSVFFRSEEYRARILAKVKDYQTRYWWENVYPDLSEQQKNSMDAVQRRIDQFLMNSTVRRITNQPRTSIPIREMLDHRGILFAKLPVERIGEKEGAFLATLFLNQIVAAAFSRQELKESERELILAFLDEVQVMVRQRDPSSLTNMLERLRSFMVGGFFIHQHTGQFLTDLLKAIMANCGARFIVGTRGEDAAVWMSQYPSSGLTKSDYESIPARQEGYGHVTLASGETVELFSFEPLPLWPLPDQRVVPVDENWHTLKADKGTAEDEQMDAWIAELAEYSPDDALELLYRAPEVLWQAYIRRCAQHRARQRRAILEQPGLIPDKRTRVLWLSRLRYARPALEVQAEQLRLLAAFPKTTKSTPSTKGRGPQGGTPIVQGGAGQRYMRGTGQEAIPPAPQPQELGPRTRIDGKVGA